MSNADFPSLSILCSGCGRDASFRTTDLQIAEQRARKNGWDGSGFAKSEVGHRTYVGKCPTCLKRNPLVRRRRLC